MRKGDSSIVEDLLNAGCSYLYLQFDTKLSLYHNIFSYRTKKNILHLHYKDQPGDTV